MQELTATSHVRRGLARVADVLFGTLLGCTHSRTTFPLTPGRKATVVVFNKPRAGTYIVCLDCGKTFQYDWAAMKVGKPCRIEPESTSLAAARSR